MKRMLTNLWLSAACLLLALGSDPGRAQHSGAHSTPSTAPRSLSPAPPMPWSNLRMNPSSSFASEWRRTRKRRCTRSQTQGWWCGSPMRTCATHTPTAARMRRIGARAKSTGSGSSGMRERIFRTSRWNFWRSCRRKAERGWRSSRSWLRRPASEVAQGRLGRSSTPNFGLRFRRCVNDFRDAVAPPRSRAILRNGAPAPASESLSSKGGGPDARSATPPVSLRSLGSPPRARPA